MKPEIKADTCPYCGAPYTVAFGGCGNKCAASVMAAKLIRSAAEGDPGELNEPPISDDERSNGPRFGGGR